MSRGHTSPTTAFTECSCHGLAKPEPKKQKRRKPWIRYERRHSNSLWHADWFERDEEQIVLLEDDASRLLTGFGSFTNATARNTVAVLEDAISDYGRPRQLMTDHGTQFTPMPRGTCPEPEPNEFQRFLGEIGIKHIKARVNHPQTNGKVERFYGTVEQKLKFFSTVEEFVSWYNEIKPHMSLNLEELETPARAFYRKLPPERVMV